MLHGEIQVESEVKKGSVFKLVLHKGKAPEGVGAGTFIVAESPLDYDERTYSECCVMGCTPKMNGGGEADFAEQSAERRNERRNIAVSEAKRGKLTIDNIFDFKADEVIT